MSLPPKPSRVHSPKTVKHMASKRLNVAFHSMATPGTNPPRAQPPTTSLNNDCVYSPISHSLASMINVPLERTRALSPALTHPSSSGCPTLGTGSPIVGPRTHSCTCASVVVHHTRHGALKTYQTLRVSALFDSTLVYAGELNLHVCGRGPVMPPHTLRALVLGSNLQIIRVAGEECACG